VHTRSLATGGGVGVMPAMLKRAMTVSSFSSTDKKKLTWRKKLRIFTDDRRVEGFTIAVVLFYFMFIILDFLVPEVVFSAVHGSKVTEGFRQFTIMWQRVFWMIDFVFLLFFLLEIAVRVYAWGMTYIRDVLNMIDFSIVFVSFIMLWVTLPYTMSGGTDSGLGTALALLRVFRIVRIFRLVVILNKIKRTRESAAMMRQKAKYKRQGSPVERVLDILQGLKRKSESGVERDNLAFMMDVIVSGDLYTVSLGSGGGGSDANASYSSFLRDGGARDAVARKGSSKATRTSVSKLKRGKSQSAGGGEQQVTEVVALDGEERDPDGHARLRFELVSELTWIDSLFVTDPVLASLKHIDSWDFNVFELERACNRNSIVVIILTYVKRLELDKQLPIDMNNLTRFLLTIQSGYKDTPFHNALHAADVTHGTAYFMSQAAVFKQLTALDLYCMLIGAAMHDFEHPGYNNAFLVAQRHDIAILYNDSSVLENFHLASAWKLMLGDQKMNPFAGFSDEQYGEARATMVHSILGTDMKFHFDHLTKFKTRLNAGAFDEPERKDVRLLLAMCLHAADVSNPAKRWDLSAEWACRVMEEFFRQGEREAELGMPVSPFMDRDKTDIAKCQCGFISILIKPFFEEWAAFLGTEHRHIFTNVEDNIKVWKEQGEGALGQKAELMHNKQPWGEPPMSLSMPAGGSTHGGNSDGGNSKSVSFKR